MRFLLDQNLPLSLIVMLRQGGHDVVHTSEIGLARATDAEVLARAKLESRCLISADTDFGEILVSSGADAPSLILLRRVDGRRPFELATFLEANLAAVATDLERGAVVVITDSRIRVRSLPL